jgi:hypothetical protein
VFEDETDFGKIEYCPVAGNETIEAINKLDLSYFDDIQQTQLRELLIKYQHVFNDTPGHCAVAEHKIDLVEGFQPKAMHPYRIPDKLKAEVDKQINQLLEDGKIRPSCSPFTLVYCVRS